MTAKNENESEKRTPVVGYTDTGQNACCLEQHGREDQEEKKNRSFFHDSRRSSASLFPQGMSHLGGQKGTFFGKLLWRQKWSGKYQGV